MDFKAIRCSKGYTMTSWIVVSESAEGPDPSPCRHYWIIQPASGPVSPGVCQFCGENREFKNSVGGHAWDDYNLGGRAGIGELTMALEGASDRRSIGEDEDR